MNTAENILDGDEYFDCEKLHCKLRKSVCVQRQEEQERRLADPGKPGKFESSWTYRHCEDCEQGKAIKAETGSRGNGPGYAPRATPGREAVPMCTDCGKRPANINDKTGKVVNGKCGHCMSRIMSEAAKKNRRSGEGMTNKMKKTCKVDGCEKKPAAQGFCGGHYSSWRQGNKKLAQQFGVYKVKSPKVSAAMRKKDPEAPAEIRDDIEAEVIELTLLELPVGNYPEIVDGLEAAGRVNIRTIEHQALAYIVAGLKKDGYGAEDAES